jgi:hypothetical protein
MWEIRLYLFDELLELMELNEASAFNVNLVKDPIIEELSFLIEHYGDFHCHIQEFHRIKLFIVKYL